MHLRHISAEIETKNLKTFRLGVDLSSLGPPGYALVSARTKWLSQSSDADVRTFWCKKLRIFLNL